MLEVNKINRLRRFQLIIAAAILLFSGAAFMSQDAKSEPVTINVFPSVPKDGTPLIVSIVLKNPLPEESTVDYELFANGKPMAQGISLLPPASSEEIFYVYRNAIGLGESINFLVRINSDQEAFEKTLNIPGYPPQVWSSFVSFATFSTSIMASSMTSVYFYNTVFIDSNAFNVGLIFSLVLIVLLVFLELTEPLNRHSTITGLRSRFSRFSIILFIVFAGMVFTKIILILM